MTLDCLKIPDTDKWIADHFDPHLQTQVSREYVKSLTRYQEHISWVMANFANFDDFRVTVQISETPPAVDTSGGKFVTPISNVKVENFRITSAASDPQHGPPSWVSSFIYIDGKFRYVGGTYTFWDEGLDGARGPTSLPLTVVHGKNVSGILGWVDTSRMEPGVEAVVLFRVEMSSNGKVHTTVEDGDASLIKDAEDYLKAQNYGRSADSDVPKARNVSRMWKAGDTGITTSWSVAVVFWTPKQ
ncbi:MAG TPA: hypothetical protein VNW47_16510 [Terriglobales bacterium]|nr:hypothetical protein [Terriglobales bacterium]